MDYPGGRHMKTGDAENGSKTNWLMKPFIEDFVQAYIGDRDMGWGRGMQEVVR